MSSPSACSWGKEGQKELVALLPIYSPGLQDSLLCSGGASDGRFSAQHFFSLGFLDSCLPMSKVRSVVEGEEA